MSKYTVRHYQSNFHWGMLLNYVVLPILICWSLPADMIKYQVYWQCFTCLVIVVYAVYRYVRITYACVDYRLCEASGSLCRLSGQPSAAYFITKQSRISAWVLLVHLRHTSHQYYLLIWRTQIDEASFRRLARVINATRAGVN